jgi:phospholipase A1
MALHHFRFAIGVLAGAVGGIMGIAPAHAQSRAVADCHGIESNAERLACYDAASGRQAAAKAAAPAAPSAPAAAPTPPAAPVRAVAESAPRSGASIIDTMWDFDASSERYAIRYYQPNYLLFGRYTNDVNVNPYLPIFEAAGDPAQLDSTEAKFQISFKGRLWTTDDRRWGVWLAYTQQNQWQVYNDDISRPFRETNYMPEAIVSYRPGLDLGGGFRWNLLNASLNHQSNGRTDLLSRSWNRAIVEAAVEREDLALYGKLWYRFKESEQDDDNPDITDYLGHGEIGAIYRWRGNSFQAMARGNVSTGKGAFQLGWTSPPILGPFRGYVQVFTGYGESMIDYNWKQTTIGAGVALNDGF